MRYSSLDARPQAQSELGSTDLFFRGCASALWEIDNVRASAWNGHIPFMFLAFQLLRPRRYVELGCHDGGSLFAACQAKARLDLVTECIAIDTWAGDPHSGFYGPEVLATLRADLLTAGHSDAILEQKLFDEAVEEFDDNSIDLLLIDGLHTYEAVKRDFESWLPKVTSGGLIMLHDTRVHERDFGVWKLWQELEVDHDTWEFSHSHGLGIVLKPGDASHFQQFLQFVQESPRAAMHLQGVLETVAERSVSHSQISKVHERAKIWHDRAVELEEQLAETKVLATEVDSLRSQLLAVGDERAELVKDVGLVTNDLLALGDEYGVLKDELSAARSQEKALAREVESLRRDVLALGDERAEIRSHYESMRVMKLMRRYWAIRNR